MQYDPGLARAFRARVMSNSDVEPPEPVARMSGAISGYERRAFYAAPGFRFAHPGYETFFTARFRQERKEAERRQTRYSTARTQRRAGRATEKAACAALPLSGALACWRSTHGTCGSDRTPPLSSSSRTSSDGTTEGRVLPAPGRPSAAGVMSPQAGHSAGRAFWPGAARDQITPTVCRLNRVKTDR